MTKQLTVTQYATQRGDIGPRGVTKAIQEKRPLPAVLSYKRMGKMYILRVDMAELEKYITEKDEVTK